MKFITIAMLSLFTVKAETLNFICEPADYSYLHKFFAQGSMVIEDNRSGEEPEQAGLILSNTKAVVSFRLAKAGNDVNYTDYVGYLLEGETKYVNTMTKAPFIYTQFILNEGDQRFDIKFLFDYSETFDSRIRDINSGYVYRANCKVIK